MKKKLLRLAGTWTLNSSRAQRMFWHTLIVALAFYLTREHSSTLAAQVASSGIDSTVVSIAAFLLLFAIVVAMFRGLIYLGEQIESELEKERSTKAHAHTLCDRALLDEIKRAGSENSAQSDTDRALTSLQTIKELVNATYQTFESAYGQVRKGQERVDFEVTFMTKSLRDTYLTVAAAANKDNRMPRSLVLRERDVEIYERTVSADTYRAPSPRITIVSDTGIEPYNELYPEQKKRIRSSIVYPVLTPDYELLGTLVVHCDKSRFFTPEKEKYLSDLLEIFAKRITLEAVRLKRSARTVSKEFLPF
jgi:GAF domain-containing protein